MSQSIWPVLGYVVLLLALASAVSVLAGGLALRLFGVAIEAVDFGLGPSLIRFRIGGVRVALKPAPLGASVTPRRGWDGEPPTMAWPVAALAQLAGPAALLAVAALSGAPEAAWWSWRVVFSLGWPFEGMTEAWTAFLDWLRSAPLREASARVFAGMAAVNLTPLPPLAGGMALYWLLKGGLGVKLADRALALTAPVGFIGFLAVIGAWTVSLGLLLMG